MARTKLQILRELAERSQAPESKQHGTPPVTKKIEKSEQKHAKPRRVDETGGVQRTFTETGVR